MVSKKIPKKTSKITRESSEFSCITTTRKILISVKETPEVEEDFFSDMIPEVKNAPTVKLYDIKKPKPTNPKQFGTHEKFQESGPSRLDFDMEIPDEEIDGEDWGNEDFDLLDGTEADELSQVSSDQVTGVGSRVKSGFK